MEWWRDGFVISTDAGRLDLDFTVDYLAQTYWGKNTPKDKIRRSIDNALIFGLYREGGGENSGKNWGQVGFCRVVSDKARFAWLSDVFVLDEMRGLGLGKWLMSGSFWPPLMPMAFTASTGLNHSPSRKILC